MIYLSIKLIHLFSVFIYGGFLFADNLILMRMEKTLGSKKYKEVRGYFSKFQREVVPTALIFAVISGLTLFSYNFGVVTDDGLSNFQIVLMIKATLGLWLGLRGVLQVFFGIQPLVFKGHLLPFILVITIIILSQLMWHV